MLYSHQQSVNERKECLKTLNGIRPFIHKMYGWDNLGTRGFIPGNKTTDLNLIEGQITLQIVSFTQIRETMSEYNILVCQVGSESIGGTNLKTESRVNVQHINIAEDKHFHKKNALVNSRFENSQLQVKPGVIIATQYFRRNLLLNLYKEGKKKYHQFVSSCRLRETKISDTCSLFPPFGEPWPSCLLASHHHILSFIISVSVSSMQSEKCWLSFFLPLKLNKSLLSGPLKAFIKSL